MMDLASMLSVAGDLSSVGMLVFMMYMHGDIRILKLKLSNLKDEFQQLKEQTTNG